MTDLPYQLLELFLVCCGPWICIIALISAMSLVGVVIGCESAAGWPDEPETSK